MEWLFLVIATLTLLCLLGTSIERLINVKNSFDNFTDISGDGEIALSPANGTMSDCDVWTCLNDFIFSILLLVNLGKQYASHKISYSGTLI